MNKNLKLVIWIIVLALLAWGLSSLNKKAPVNPAGGEVIKIGAILPLTGSSAVWGEHFKNGMEMAKTDWAKRGVNVDIIYEDSRADAPTGVTAYNKLVSTDKVDLVVTALSRITVPILPLAEQNKTPLIASIVSALGVADNPYALRLFVTADQYAAVHFPTFKKQGIKKIAVLYINDEYGISINDSIERIAKDENIQVVADESFLPNDNDFRSSLAKIKQASPDALMYVGLPPAALVGVVRQFNELGLKAKFFETGSNLLVLESIRKDLGGAADGKYTVVFASFFSSSAGKFNSDYRKIYGAEPFMSSSPFGYEVVDLLAQVTNGKSMTGQTLIDAIINLGELDSVNGKTAIQANGEINSEVASGQIVNDQVVLIK